VAKAFRAVTRIEHGEADEQGNEVRRYVFEPGEIVKGLRKEVMSSLWDAGALEEATVVTTMELEDEPAPSTSPTESAPTERSKEPR